MRPKSSKPTNDELLAQFDDLTVESAVDQEPSKTASKPPATATTQSEQDIFAELDSLTAQRPSSGPGTPRVSTNEPRPVIKSPKPAAAGRASEEKPVPRKSGESVRASVPENKSTNVIKPESEKVVATEAATSSGGGGGGWWGGIFATASAAMKQAEAAVKEIQQNEEAQKWAQQVKGNVGALRDLGMVF